MEKRLVLAIALSLLVLLTWSTLTAKFYPAANKGVTKEISSTPAPGRPSSAVAISSAPIDSATGINASKNVQFGSAPKTIPAEQLLKFSNDKVEVTFIEPQAAIQEIVFKNHQNSVFSLGQGFLLLDDTLRFKKERSTPTEVQFGHFNAGKRVTKTFIFNDDYTINLVINVQSTASAPLKLSLPIELGELVFGSKNVQFAYQDVAIVTQDKSGHFNGHKDVEMSNLKFLGLRDRYFCAILDPQAGNYFGFVRKLNTQASIAGLSAGEITLAPGEQYLQEFRIYLGPQDLRSMNAIFPEWSAIIYFGTFDFIGQLLLQLLEFLFRLVHNWGWAIIILSLLVYLLLYPLTLKQMRSMKEMQVLQPRIEELRKAYKDNPKKMNEEIMKLYREHKVNPFGGCLPLIVQMPIFFALYQVLMRSVALKGAPFLWIKDLSQPDRLFLLPVSLPILGNEVNILPVVMALGMFFQQKMSMAGASGAAAEQQKMMLIIMPIMFGFIFYRMPSGLVLYWFVNSAMMLFYQMRIHKKS